MAQLFKEKALIGKTIAVCEPFDGGYFFRFSDGDHCFIDGVGDDMSYATIVDWQIDFDTPVTEKELAEVKAVELRRQRQEIQAELEQLQKKIDILDDEIY